jgi:hypothetical protein
MKINFVKSFLGFGIGVLIGLLCFAIAKEEPYKWVSLIIAAATNSLSLVAAIGYEYNCGARNVNIKVTAWLGALIVIVANIIFSCFEYNILVYITIMLLITLMLVAGLYGLHKPERIKS